MAEPTFDRVADDYTEYLGKMRGWMRQEVVRTNLYSTLQACEHTFEQESLQVLDFGGGRAGDALWLAEMGHNVTIVDDSPAQISLGRAAVARADSEEIADRIAFIEGSAEELTGMPGDFHLALSHGVLQYELDDPIGQLSAIAKSLQSKGRLSLLTKNYFGVINKLMPVEGFSETDLASFEESDIFVASLGEGTNERVAARAYTLSRLGEMLRESGFGLVERNFGVRVHTDGDNRDVAAVPPSERMVRHEREIASSRDERVLQAAAMLHVVALKV